MNNRLTQEEIEKYTWREAGHKYVWKCLETGNFHFENEANMLDETEYDYLDECIAALNKYEEYLSNQRDA